MKTHTKGLLLAIAGVTILSPDALIVRMIEADPWTLLFWRGLLLMAGLIAFSVLVEKQSPRAQFAELGRSSLAIAVLFGLSTICFINALANTSVAHTLVIIASAPLFTALFSFALLKERVSFATLFTMFTVLVGIGFVVSDTSPGNSLKGDLFAFSTSSLIALVFVATRKFRAKNMVPGMALSGGFVALAVLPFAAPFSVLPQDLIWFVLAGLVTTAAFGLLTVAPRYMPAAEVSLIMPLETVIGTLLVWWAIGEQPSVLALFGGALVIGALTLHSLYQINTERPIS